MRSAILGPESPRFSATSLSAGGAGRAPRPSRDGAKSNLWLGPNRHFVHYFVGAGRYVNWVGVVPDEWRVESWTAKGEIADALAKFDGWHRRVRQIIAAADTTNRWALYDCDPLDTWAIGRVALLGDAAHAMLPFMAQGAVQSVEDAAVLAKCLGAVDAGGVAAALRRYEAIRKPRASQCQLGSRNNAVMYHMPDGEEQRRRDANLSAAIYGLGSRTWLYAHDVEAAMETMQEERLKIMSTLPGYRRTAEGTDPPYDHSAYTSTHKRAPKRSPIRIAHTLSEITGPRLGAEMVGAGDADLTHFAGGEALGERIVVTGRVLDEDGRAVPNALVEIWQANSAGRYAHEVDQHDAPLDPNFPGRPRARPTPTASIASLPSSRPPIRGKITSTRGGRSISTSASSVPASRPA